MSSLPARATERPIAANYRDPLEEIWLATLRALGLRIERTDAVYARYDGRRTLELSRPEQLDADDSLAQLIFHELCHALVAGPGAFELEDWGLCNQDARDVVKEHACHRVQAALASRYGLRAFFAVTTDHRAYWDALPEDPLADGDDPAIELARAAFARAEQPPFAPALHAALSRTARIAEAVRELAAEGSLWRLTEPSPR
jgi:hypothetical protein